MWGNPRWISFYAVSILLSPLIIHYWFYFLRAQAYSLILITAIEYDVTFFLYSRHCICDVMWCIQSIPSTGFHLCIVYLPQRCRKNLVYVFAHLLALYLFSLTLCPSLIVHCSRIHSESVHFHLKTHTRSSLWKGKWRTEIDRPTKKKEKVKDPAE